MISLRHRFAFVHVNKTGGTSICEALRPCEDVQDLVRDHDPARKMVDVLGPALWDEMFSFAFVRNPWDRMVSSYEYRRQYLAPPGALPAADLGFRDWMLGVVAADPRDREWSDQLWMVTDRTGDIIVSRLYLYDDLADGYADACARIGLDPAPPLGRYNETRREAYHYYYDAETDALVRERFARDLAWAGANHPGRWMPPVYPGRKTARPKRVKRPTRPS